MPVPEQAPRDASLGAEVTPSDRGPHDHIPESRDNIAGSAERAPRRPSAPKVTSVEEELRRA